MYCDVYTNEGKLIEFMVPRPSGGYVHIGNRTYANQLEWKQLFKRGGSAISLYLTGDQAKDEAKFLEFCKKFVGLKNVKSANIC